MVNNRLYILLGNGCNLGGQCAAEGRLGNVCQHRGVAELCACGELDLLALLCKLVIVGRRAEENDADNPLIFRRDGAQNLLESPLEVSLLRTVYMV